jgi:hypothetical protein
MPAPRMRALRVSLDAVLRRLSDGRRLRRRSRLLPLRRRGFHGMVTGPAGTAGGEDRDSDPDRCPHGSRR